MVFPFLCTFLGKKLRKDSKTYQDLPSLLEMSILFTLADVAAVAKTWSTTGIHFLLLKPRKAKGSGDTPWYYGCTVYVCKSVLHCVFKVLSVSPSHEVELLICVGCFDNVLLYMLTKSWRNIFFSHFAIQQSGKRQNHVFLLCTQIRLLCDGIANVDCIFNGKSRVSGSVEEDRHTILKV